VFLHGFAEGFKISGFLNFLCMLLPPKLNEHGVNRHTGKLLLLGERDAQLFDVRSTRIDPSRQPWPPRFGAL
jgi:hypothetical protein